MATNERPYPNVAIAVPEVLLPRRDVELEKWPVVACDQYTSDPEYWRKVAERVGDAPSTLNLIYPEVFLGEPDPDARIARIRATMKRYLDEGVLEPTTGFVYLERSTSTGVRKGLLVALDLDRYDFRQGSTSLVRATEGTIVERLPPRIKIREGAPIELPHIMVLIDDPGRSVIEPLGERSSRGELERLYDFDLMMNAGHLRGWRVNGGAGEASVVAALGALGDPAGFAAKYGLPAGTPPLLYAMGDGNHSLATAKAIWDRVKATAAPDDPRRYALVELVNLHDEALVFEPIHRVLFELSKGLDLWAELNRYFGGHARRVDAKDVNGMSAEVTRSTSERQRFGVIQPSGYAAVELTGSGKNLPVGSLQAFLDELKAAKKFREIDYVHGTSAVDSLGRREGNAGFFLPAIDKHDLFKTVILDGALPRKTFSMGEADDKRFYMEARKI